MFEHLDFFMPGKGFKYRVVIEGIDTVYSRIRKAVFKSGADRFCRCGGWQRVESGESKSTTDRARAVDRAQTNRSADKRGCTNQSKRE